MSAQLSQSVDKLLRKAHLHINAGEVVQAEEIYRHILAKFPKNKKAIRGYQKLKNPQQATLDNLIGLFNSGRFRETIALGKALTAQFPKEPILYEVLGATSLRLGNDEETIQYYQKLLQINPINPDAYNNLGLVFYKKGDFFTAAEVYQKAIKIEPGFADAHYNLGNSLKQMDKLEDAIESYQTSLAINPDDIEVLSSYGNALMDFGEFKKAIECYTRVLQVNPNLTETQNNLDKAVEEDSQIDKFILNYQEAIGEEANSPKVMLFKGTAFDLKGYNEMAIKYFKQAIKIRPDYAEAFNRLGMVYTKIDKPEDALECYEKATEIEPSLAEAHYNLGYVFEKQGNRSAAKVSFDRALDINPNHAEAINSLGFFLRESGDFDASIEKYKQAIKIKPDFAEAYGNMGIAHKEKGELNLAIKSFKKALEINPKLSDTHNNSGTAYKDIGDLDAAINSYEKAIDLDPDYAAPHWNQCLAYLTKGDFEKGWPKYDWRWKANEDMKGTYISTSKPIWNHGRGQRVLLWAEQGIGDEVMFASIIPELHALCSKLIVNLDERLIPIFNRSFPNDIEYRPRRKPISESEYDAHIPIGSLPQYFRQTAESFKKSSKGWLVANEKKADSLRKKLLTDETETLIGISWHSTTPRLGAEAKVLTLNQIAKSLHEPKTKLINLQYGDVSEEIERLNNEHGIEVIRLPEIDNTNDLDGLASLIMACDKVVSISNFSIHLAGALGKEAHVLLAYSSDWRWGQKPNSNYWYDSVCLHRQTSVNDWNAVLRSVRRCTQLDFRAA